MMPAVREQVFAMRVSSVARLAVVATALAVGLSACGRRGPLEPPPGAADVAKPDKLSQEAESETPGVKTLTPSITPAGSRKSKPITAPDRPFILDKIL